MVWSCSARPEKLSKLDKGGSQVQEPLSEILGDLSAGGRLEGLVLDLLFGRYG